MKFTNKVVIVTGSGSGFGAGIAKRFASEGASVVVADLNLDSATKTAAEIESAGGKAVACAANVANKEGADHMVATAVEAFGKLDVLVNNAGVPQTAQFFADVSEKTYDLIFDVNTKAIYICAAAAIEELKKTEGVIVNVTSVSGARPRPNAVAYGVSKAAATAMTKALALELAPFKVRVVAVAPVAGDTPMLAKFLGDESEEKRAMAVSTIPLGRLATPDDIASGVLFLASDEASLMTGIELPVDGGRSV